MAVRVFFTSDLHFWHTKVIQKCNRPFASLEEMHEHFIKVWNELIGPNDIVYILGDFSFGGVEKIKAILARLNGRKILIIGNHDKKYKPEKWISMGMMDAREEAQVYLAGQLVTLTHFPFAPTRWQRFLSWAGLRPKEDKRYLDHRPKNRGQWLLCGHEHCSWKILDRMINVGIDQWKRPVSMEEIKAIIEASDERNSGVFKKLVRLARSWYGRHRYLLPKDVRGRHEECDQGSEGSAARSEQRIEGKVAGV